MTTTNPDAFLLPAGDAAVPARSSSSRWGNLRQVLGVALRSPTFVIGAIVLAFWIFDAIFWSKIVPYSPTNQTLTSALAHPSSAHLLGTDNLGRDVFSRVLAGASSVLVMAPIGTAIGLVGGIILGLVCGYYRGAVDVIMMRLVDAILSLPGILIGALVLSLLGRSETGVTLIIGFVFIPVVARTVRSTVLAEREKEYVAAAKLRGESGAYIMGAEILPNITAPIIVEGTVRLGYAIFLAASLSYLGLGLNPPSPDWGLTISNEFSFIQVQVWTVLAPAIALGTLVVAVSLVSDGLRKAIDS